MRAVGVIVSILNYVAATSSSLNDGAAALVVMSMSKAQQMGLKPLARIVSFADAEQAPIDFTTSPSIAIPRVSLSFIRAFA